ncbi:IscA/HesB family protein [Desulfomicrobium escambiense]|uniref:IscA/HesB family protein n=1 Tax=Desulfomicrobium escambiense TaxID=29503 RepID=UPI00040FDDC3|nr:IscA/HesB family protein [Desulfomicrobium escambiense]
MFILQPAAKEQLDQHFNGKDKEPIRIYLASGCGGPRLGLALDEHKTGDQVFEIDGYSFLMEEALFEQAKPVTVLFDQNTGFSVESSMVFPEGGGCSSCGCGGSCS